MSFISDDLDSLFKDGNYFDSIEFSNYGKIYPYTTENIRGYMMDCKDKNVLSVIGSGDFFLNLATLNARNIDSFDINELAVYFLKLKKAAVSELNLNEFYYFLEFDAETYYPRVRERLDDDSRKFWDCCIKNLRLYTGLLDSPLFFPRLMGGDYTRRNYYMSEDGYQILKSNLEKIPDGKIYTTDIYELINVLDTKYDQIYLSNINSYQRNNQKFRDFLIKLRNTVLSDNGEIFAGYSYRGLDKQLLFLHNSIDRSQIIDIDSIANNGNNKDKVLIIKK